MVLPLQPGALCRPLYSLFPELVTEAGSSLTAERATEARLASQLALGTLRPPSSGTRITGRPSCLLGIYVGFWESEVGSCKLFNH